MEIKQINRNIFQILLIFILYIIQSGFFVISAFTSMAISMILVVILIFSNLRNILLIFHIRSKLRVLFTMASLFSNMLFILLISFDYVFRTEVLTYLVFSSILVIDMFANIAEDDSKKRRKVRTVKSVELSAPIKQSYYYTTLKGKTLHRRSCQTIKGKKTHMYTMDEADAKGFSKCKICLE